MRFTTAVMCLAMVTCAFAATGKGKKAAPKADAGKTMGIHFVEDIEGKDMTKDEKTLPKDADFKVLDAEQKQLLADTKATFAALTALSKADSKKNGKKDDERKPRFETVATKYVAQMKSAIALLSADAQKVIDEAKTAADAATAEADKKTTKAAHEKVVKFVVATEAAKITAEVTKLTTALAEAVYKVDGEKCTVEEAGKKAYVAVLASIKKATETFIADAKKNDIDLSKYTTASKESSAFPIWAIILIVVAVVAVVGGIVFCMMKKKNESD